MELSIWILIIATVFGLFGIVLLIRNEMVYKYRTRAINSIKPEDWSIEHFKYTEAGSYDSMLYDFRKWTYKQFFPKFSDEEEAP